MRLAIFAALAALIMISATKAEPDHRQIISLATTCDNDGHCSTLNANVDASDSHKNRHRRVTAAVAKDGHRSAAIDANGNTAGLVISHKTGARARVGVAYAARFQTYIDDLENNHGARVLFMNGIRPGRCSPESQHPCGKALDVCQLGWGKVDPRCNLPDRVTLGRIATAHGLFEGGRWCHSDYGHAQTSVTAAACGDGPFRIVRRTTPEPIADEPRP
jgi:hypothetical protein